MNNCLVREKRPTGKGREIMSKCSSLNCCVPIVSKWEVKRHPVLPYLSIIFKCNAAK